MSKLIILVLLVVWAIVLLPDVAQRLSRTRRSDSIRSFSTQLSSLGRANGHHRSHGNVIDLRTRSAIDLRSPSIARGPQPAPSTQGSTLRQAGSAPAGSGSVRPRRAAPCAPSLDGPARPVSPAMRKRRQDVLVVLGSVALLTLMATVAFGGAFLVLHLLADVLLVTYLVLLAQVMSVVPPTVTRSRQESLAPLSPLDNLRTATVGPAVPVETRQIAN